MTERLVSSDGPYEVFISHLGTVRATGDALKKAQRARTARFEVINVEQNRGELDVMVSGKHQKVLYHNPKNPDSLHAYFYI